MTVGSEAQQRAHALSEGKGWRMERSTETVEDDNAEAPGTSRRPVDISLSLDSSPSALPWALAAFTKSRACCQGPRTVLDFGDVPPLQGPWAEQHSLACCGLPRPPRGGTSLDPQSTIDLDPGMTGTYFPAGLLLYSSKRPLSQTLDLNFPLQGMFRSGPAEGQRSPPAAGWQLLSPLPCPPHRPSPARAAPVHSPFSGPGCRKPARRSVQPG